MSENARCSKLTTETDLGFVGPKSYILWKRGVSKRRVKILKITYTKFGMEVNIYLK